MDEEAPLIPSDTSTRACYCVASTVGGTQLSAGELLLPFPFVARSSRASTSSTSPHPSGPRSQGAQAVSQLLIPYITHGTTLPPPLSPSHACPCTDAIPWDLCVSRSGKEEPRTSFASRRTPPSLSSPYVSRSSASFRPKSGIAVPFPVAAPCLGCHDAIAGRPALRPHRACQA
jgi:hypothetical protein